MQNQFEAANYPTTEPTEVVAGARWAWKKPEVTAVYPTSLYTLKYRFALQTSPYTAFDFNAVKTDSEHVIEREIAETTTRAPGEYLWRSFVVRDSDSAEVSISEGVIEISPSLESGADSRSHTLRVLQAIRATIEGTATQDQLRIEVAGRIIERRSISELMDMEQEYRKRYRREKQEIDRKAGRPAKTRTLVKMRA